MRWTPHKYQERAIQFAVELQNCALLLDPGLGKTSIVLAAIKILKKLGFVVKILVVVPLRPMYNTWPNEIEKWDDFNGLSYGILHGGKKDQVLEEDHDIYLINPEGLRWLSVKLARRKPFPFHMLVVDESSKFKESNTQRFKTLKPMLKKFKRRIILTGSFAPNSLMDVFSQMFIVDQGESFGPFITHFRAEHFYRLKHTTVDDVEYNEWVLKPGAEQRIYDIIAPRALRMSAEDYLEMPEIIYTDIWVDLPPKARQMYDQFENILRLDFKEGRIVAANAAVAVMKLRQIANGGIYLDPEINEEDPDAPTKAREWKHLHDAKTEVVVDLIDELEGQPALIAYEFQHDLERLKKALGKDTPHLGGGMNAKTATRVINEWNAGKHRAVLGQPQSIAHGVNLQERGRAVIWHSMTYRQEDYDQFIRRVWRQGQTARVFVYRILARNTVDEILVAALETKTSRQNRLYAALKKYWS